jgi:hypothetical protein
VALERHARSRGDHYGKKLRRAGANHGTHRRHKAGDILKQLGWPRELHRHAKHAPQLEHVARVQPAPVQRGVHGGLQELAQHVRCDVRHRVCAAR